MKQEVKPDDYYLEHCKKLVEEKLGWGCSETWSHADFLEASEKISEDSGIALSVTTIKRVWGKVNYNGSPATSTLNALAVYLGFDNWRAFKTGNDIQKKAFPQDQASYPKPETQTSRSIELRKLSLNRKKRKNLFIPYLSTLILLICALYFLSGREKDITAFETEDIVFNSEPVTTGLPNTVVFNYDIAALEFDSAFIQQNWDARRRQKIERKNKQMTSVYYYPGHFHAKLMLNDHVAKEHGLLIPTEGWLGIIDRNGYDIPTYILPPQIINEKALQVPLDVLHQKNIDTNKEFQLTYSNSRDFQVDGDNFTFETAIKNNIDEGGAICQESSFLLDGESGIIWVPLSAPGCVGNLNLQFGEVYVNGKNNDLSAFGADLSSWNHLKYIVKNKKIAFLVNDRLVYSASYEKPIGNIYGINFRFKGAGAVKYVKLKDTKDKVVYEDGFAPLEIKNNL